MCRRYTLSIDNLKKEWEDQAKNLAFETSYNITPLTTVPIILSGESKKLQISEMKWGFEFSTQDGEKHRVTKAKGESLAKKLMFSQLLSSNRCLIPVSGYYVWQKTKHGKIPHYITLKDQEIFYFAGLHRKEKYNNAKTDSCVIVTTKPNQFIQPLHNRMPFIITKDLAKTWLESSNEQALESIAPYPADLMQSHTVSKDVNLPINDNATLIEEYTYNF